MLVRAGDGEWLQLRPVGELPPDGVRSLCGADAATMLELEEPLPVAAFGTPHDEHMVDAICLTREGGIALLVATFGEEPSRSLWRLSYVAGALRGMSLEVFAANCTEAHGAWPPEWLAERVGGDAGWLEGRLRETLEHGAFDLMLVTAAGAGELATPLRFLESGPANVRVYEVEIMRAGDVQALEGVEVTLDGERAAPRRFEATAHDAAPRSSEAEVVPEGAFEGPVEEEHADHVPEPVQEAPLPEPEPEPEVEVEPEVQAEPEPEAEAEPASSQGESASLGEPSDEAAFLAAVDRLDHRSSAHVRFLHAQLLRFVGHGVYTRDSAMQYFVGWSREAEPRPLVGLDSNGAFTVVLRSLPEHEQAEYANELAGLIPDATGEALLEVGVAELSVTEHLADETLLQYVVDNLAEALPGGRQAWAEVTHDVAEGPVDQVDDDYFAGVSATHDPADLEATFDAHGPADQPAEPGAQSPDPEAATEHQSQPAEPRHRGGGFARRLRRRDAA